MRIVLYTYTIITFLFAATYTANSHPVHLGIINIEILNNEETHCSIHLYEADLLSYLFEKQNFKKNIQPDSLYKTIHLFLREKLILSFNEIPINYQLKQKKQEGELIILELEIPIIKDISKIKLENKIFHDVFPDQATLLFCTIESKTLTHKMDFRNNQIVIEL